MTLRNALMIILLTSTEKELLEKLVNDPETNVNFDYNSINAWNGLLEATCLTFLGSCRTFIDVKKFEGSSKKPTNGELKRIALTQVVDGNIEVSPLQKSDVTDDNF